MSRFIFVINYLDIHISSAYYNGKQMINSLEKMSNLRILLQRITVDER